MTEVANRSVSAFGGLRVHCCGADLEPDIALLQARMTARRVPLEEQQALWLDFMRQLPHPRWAALCLDQAEALQSLLDRERALRPAVRTACEPDAPLFPLSAHATAHFEWRGTELGVDTASLREGILFLSRIGLIAPDAAQQDALRRGLGCSVNADERRTPIPWVRWTGPVDMLNYLVAELFRAGLIGCAGGPQQKWNTLCGFVLRADGQLFRPSVKSSRCLNPAKRTQLDTHFLRPMTRLLPVRK